MKKIVALVLLGVVLTGCIENGEDITESSRVKTICLDNVEYWILDATGHSQALAPKVDPTTLSFIRCK